jgi:hypothetical protein
MKIFLLIIPHFTVFFSSAYSQDKPDIKPGKVSPGDFIVNSPVVDSNSEAVVLADVGTCEFIGNNKGWFSIVYTKFKRVKICNKNGFPAATVKMLLYKSGDLVEKVKELKGATYNLVNGSVVSTKLDDKMIFNDVLDKNYLEEKFTFPAVREGSIIEFSYQVESEFLFLLPSWKFQGRYPCLWSSYEVRVPGIFNYMILKQGNLNYFINSTDQKSKVYKVTKQPDQSYPPEDEKIYAVNTDVTIKNWVMKDVPAMRVQDYTSSIENYISKLEFQLSEYRFPRQPIEKKMKDWQMVSTEMLKDADFGRPIAEDNPWVADELKNIQTAGLTDEQKARNIFAYVRDHYTCTRDHGIFLSDNMNLRLIIKKKSGSVSDLNLLLISMLRQSGITADPVMLCTREQGRMNAQYPMLEKFDYVICRANINGRDNFLDASDQYLGFGRLEPKCYNGMARVITEQAPAINLNADDISENKNCYVTLVNKSSGLAGKYQTLLGYNASLELRQKMSGDISKDYLIAEEKKYSDDVTLSNAKFDSLRSYDNPVSVTCDVNVSLKNDEVIYFNPMMGEQMKENPFKAQHRLYPVELPYTMNTSYNFTMEIPTGYKVEEMPKGQVYVMPDNKVKFEYNLTEAFDHIQLRCTLQLSKTFFAVEEYDNVRAFFAQVISKESEQIVFRKSK